MEINLPEGKKLYFASDNHLGAPTYKESRGGGGGGGAGRGGGGDDEGEGDDEFYAGVEVAEVAGSVDGAEEVGVHAFSFPGVVWAAEVSSASRVMWLPPSAAV